MSVNIYQMPIHTPVRLYKIKGYVFENDDIKITKFGWLINKKLFRWDGCTFKINFFGMILGIPEGEMNDKGESKTKIPSYVHDQLYKHKKELKKIGIKKKTMDLEFLLQMKKQNFMPRRFYYRAVRLFGWLF